MPNEFKETNIVELQQEYEGATEFTKQRKEKCILVHEHHMHNVNPWNTFTRVQYKLLRRVA
jgi:hypothetical protein